MILEDDNGRAYEFNKNTGVSRWREPPLDQMIHHDDEKEKRGDITEISTPKHSFP